MFKKRKLRLPHGASPPLLSGKAERKLRFPRGTGLPFLSGKAGRKLCLPRLIGPLLLFEEAE